MDVLIVEDTFPAFLVAKTILTAKGFNVYHAKDGPEAVEKATSKRYAFILMDIGLPVFDGIEATKKIREAGVTAPIFALSANLGQHTEESLNEAGMQGCYEKPFGEENLIELLKLLEINPPNS